MTKQSLITFMLIVLLSNINQLQSYANIPIAPKYAQNELSIYNSMKNAGYENIYVAINDTSTELLIQFDSKNSKQQILQNYIYLSRLAFTNYTNFDTLLIESYRYREPYMSFAADKNTIRSFVEGKIDVDEYINHSKINDLRNVESIIRDDLIFLDTHVHEINVKNESIIVTISYKGNEHELVNDIFAMATIIVENAPWVDKITMNFLLNDKKETTFLFKTDDILDVISGNISLKEFSNKSHIKTKKIVEPFKWQINLSYYVNKIRLLPYGEILIQIAMVLASLMALVLLNMFFRLFRRLRG